MNNHSYKQYIILLSCQDRAGIVAHLTSQLAAIGADIKQSNQFSDTSNNRFFMRLLFKIPNHYSKEKIFNYLEPLFSELSITAHIHDINDIPKIIIMVSRQDHALMDLLYQVKVGWLKAKIVAIVSNHQTTEELARQANIPYYYWPVGSTKSKQEQEKKLRKLFIEKEADLLVLARYMQILSNKFCHDFNGKIINIHHSFLPSFKGARPYQQAWERGVKLIGATAHYVTPDLDEGPIIEQDTTRVDHSLTAEDFVAKGRNIECHVLTQAVKLYTEYRIMLNGRRTIIFS